ncbi:MAG: diguanylate cyclase [Myxococcota bacterium]
MNAYLACYHLVLFVRRRQATEHLPFAALCISVAAYDLASMGLYGATSLAQGLFWQRLQLDLVCLIAASMIEFVSVLAGIRDRRVVRFSRYWFALLLLATLAGGPDLTLSVSTPSIKPIRWGDTLVVTYFESELGPVYLLVVASAVAAYLYLLVSLVRRGGVVKHRWPIVGSLVVYFLGIANDILVAGSVYPFVYVSEYAFMVIVLSMAYVLLDSFVSLHTQLESLNVDLGQRVDERTAEIRQLNEELRRQAEQDGLTRAYNRRFFDDYLAIEFGRATSGQLRTPTSNGPVPVTFGLALIDIDDFKQINDTHGHPVGDAVLKELVSVISEHKFLRDLVCRYGGEEFALVLTNTSTEGVARATEKICRAVHGHPFCVAEVPPGLHVTVSIGLALSDEVPRGRADKLVQLADSRLYQAKRSGKNRVVSDGFAPG